MFDFKLDPKTNITSPKFKRNKNIKSAIMKYAPLFQIIDIKVIIANCIRRINIW